MIESLMDMKQFEYQIHNKQTGCAENVRATAKTPEIARAQVVLMYGLRFDVAALFCEARPAHHVLGEINCADFLDKDIPWLMAEAAKIEGRTACLPKT